MQKKSLFLDGCKFGWMNINSFWSSFDDISKSIDPMFDIKNESFVKFDGPFNKNISNFL